MFRTLISLVLSITLFCLVPQVQAAPKADKNSTTATSGARQHLGNIVFAGLAGAILGLSTLSFYGRPQDRLSNIAVGFAIGIIAGTLITTYQAATEPKDFYGLERPAEAQTWVAQDDLRLHNSNSNLPRASWTFSF